MKRTILTVCTSDCEWCRYGTVVEESRARVTVLCARKGKKYIYGQRVPCDCMERVGNAAKEGGQEIDGE